MEDAAERWRFKKPHLVLRKDTAMQEQVLEFKDFF